MKTIKLPELGEGIDEAVLSTWLIKEGAAVNEGDDVVEMATDKATFNVPSPLSGTIKKHSREEGDTVKVGEVLAELE